MDIYHPRLGKTMKNKIVLNTVICTSVFGVTGSYSSMCLNALSDSHANLNNKVAQQKDSFKKPQKASEIRDSNDPYKDFYYDTTNIKADHLEFKGEKSSSNFRYLKFLYLIPEVVISYTIASMTGLFLAASTDAITNKIVGIKPVETLFSWFKDKDSSY